jgi:D-glycero-D-manno-heptose 1,7-bisphosphate phosphatase
MVPEDILSRLSSLMKAAVFLDRDGVLVQDVDLIVRREQLHLLDGVPASLDLLKHAGFALIVVSNQTVVARGMATEAEVMSLNAELQSMIVAAGGPQLDGWYFCPHHPKATLPAYRLDCACRKPLPGMLQQAAREHDLELVASYMVGDRITDIAAGTAAGCRTILVQTGKHTAPPIETSEPLDDMVRPDQTCADLPAAVRWLLHAGSGPSSGGFGGLK